MSAATGADAKDLKTKVKYLQRQIIDLRYRWSYIVPISITKRYLTSLLSIRSGAELTSFMLITSTGGLGHMAVKFAAAFGAAVTVLSSSVDQ